MNPSLPHSEPPSGRAGGLRRTAPRLPRRTVRQACLWGSILLILASGAASGYRISALTAHTAWIRHTEMVLGELQELLLILTDAESSARGYFVTGREIYLGPYNAALLAAPTALARIRALTADNPNQQTRIDALAPLVNQRFGVLADLVTARKRAGSAAALDATDLARSKALMGQVRSVIREIIRAEQTLYAIRDREVDRQARLTAIFLLLGTAASIAALGAAYHLMAREAARRRQAERTLQDLNAALERRVAARTLALERAAEEHRSAAETLQAIIDEAPLAVITLDPDRNVMIWSRAAERIFGYAAHEVLGRPYPLVPPGGQAEFDDIFGRSAAGERLRGIAVRRRRKDGALVNVVFSGAPLYDRNGALRSIVFLLEDVTVRKVIERQLHEAQKMEAVGQLTGGLAHDFNNLLGIVIGNLDLLDAHLEASAEARDLARSALGAALRGAELTRQLLAFARKQPLDPQTIDLNALVAGMTALLRRTLGERVEIAMALADGLWASEADPAQVESALVNLAINARDAMPEGGRLTIETANRVLDAHYAAENADVVPGEYAMLAVTDTGTGIPPAVLARVFEPFFTTKETGKGTGLGLPMIYGFAKQSGGHVKIYSEVGHGTTVRLYLPRAAAVDRHAAAKISPDEVQGGGETILVVEDHAEVRRTAVRQLASLGYRVLQAENGPAALAVLAGEAPVDLLFTDIVMPGGMTGVELARRARALRPGLRVLYTSGFTEAAVQNGDGSPEPKRLLSKPYRKQELARKVSAALRDEEGATE